MKKFISGLLTGLIITVSITTFANSKFTLTKSPFPIKVNGTEFKSDLPILNYQGNTYVPLRAVGDLLETKVDFKDNVINIGEAKDSTVTDEQSVKPIISNTEYTKFKNMFTLDTNSAKPYYEKNNKQEPKRIRANIYYIGTLNKKEFINYWENLKNKELIIQKLCDELQKDNPDYSLYLNIAVKFDDKSYRLGSVRTHSFNDSWSYVKLNDDPFPEPNPPINSIKY